MFGEFDSVLHTNLFTTEQNTAESVRESLNFHYRTKRVEMEGRFGTVLPPWEIVPIKIIMIQSATAAIAVTAETAIQAAIHAVVQATAEAAEQAAEQVTPQTPEKAAILAAVEVIAQAAAQVAEQTPEKAAI